MAVSSLVQASGGVTQKVEAFTSTSTWTAPANCFAVEVFLVAGGGGGGGARNTSTTCTGGGGGGGSVRTRRLPVTPGTSYTITVGAGGAGSADNSTASDGNNTSFGALLTAFGGGGGGTVTSTGTEQTPNVNGTSGGNGRNSNSGATGGGGAAYSFYPARLNSTVGTNAPNDNQAYGSISNTLLGGLSSYSPDSSGAIQGPGIDGFGGGGAPGSFGWGNSQGWRKISVAGGGVGGIGSENGGAGAANTGGGGGGASNNASTARAGGNGGSGYVLITYWS